MNYNMDKNQTEKMEELFNELQKDEIEYEKIKEAEKKTVFLGNMKNDFLILTSIIKEYYNGDFYIPSLDLTIIIATISYVLLPLDAIPDFIPIVGFVDDITIIKLCLSKITETLNKYKKYKENK